MFCLHPGKLERREAIAKIVITRGKGPEAIAQHPELDEIQRRLCAVEIVQQKNLSIELLDDILRDIVGAVEFWVMKMSRQ